MSPLDNTGGLDSRADSGTGSGIIMPDRTLHRVRDAGLLTWNALAGRKDARVIGADPGTLLFQADALRWMERLPDDSIHGMPTDPPYGLIEYEDKDHGKLRSGRGGVWRVPPSMGGSQRAPLPRFTILTPEDRKRLEAFFTKFAPPRLASPRPWRTPRRRLESAGLVADVRRHREGGPGEEGGGHPAGADPARGGSAQGVGGRVSRCQRDGAVGVGAVGHLPQAAFGEDGRGEPAALGSGRGCAACRAPSLSGT